MLCGFGIPLHRLFRVSLAKLVGNPALILCLPGFFTLHR
jgi:hypothetical protein